MTDLTGLQQGDLFDSESKPEWRYGSINSARVEDIPLPHNFPLDLPKVKFLRKRELIVNVIKKILDSNGQDLYSEIFTLCNEAFTDIFEVTEIPEMFIKSRKNVTFDRISRFPVFKPQPIWEELYIHPEVTRPVGGPPGTSINYEFPDEIHLLLTKAGIYENEIQSAASLSNIIIRLISIFEHKFPNLEYLSVIIEAIEICFNNFHLYLITQNPDHLLVRYGLPSDLPGFDGSPESEVNHLWLKDNSEHTRTLMNQNKYSHWFARWPNEYELASFMEIYYKPGKVLLYTSIGFLEENGLILYDTKESQSIVFIEK